MKTIALALLLALPCYAAKNAALTPILAKPGKTVFEQNFDSGSLDKPWAVAKGDWQIVDGAIVGREKAEDKHAGVLSLALPNKDSIVSFSIKLDGAKGADLSFNHAKGHLFRLGIAPDGLTLRTDADKKDKSIKSVALGKAGVKFEPGQWVTLLVEVKGNQIAVQTDNGAKIAGSDSRVSTAKVNYRFVVKGAAVAIDDLKISEAQ